jgi:hypothetical protein
VVGCGVLGGGFSGSKKCHFSENFLWISIACCALRIRNVLFRLRDTMIGWNFGLFCLLRRVGLVGVLGAGLMAKVLLGQEAAPAAAPVVGVSGAMITGSVICADTNGPARLAQVILRSTTPSDSGAEMLKGLEQFRGAMDGDDAKKPTLTKEQEADQKKQAAELARTANMMADTGHTVPVALDGTYRFTNVPPGTYQIRATLTGYIDPLGEFSPEDFQSQDPAMRKRIAAAAQVVTISSNEGAHVDLRLERGASISGKVIFEDGSPAIGWQVLSAVAPAKGGENPFGSGGALGTGGVKSLLHLPATTDDTGHFRLSGLSSGDYVLQARVNVMGMDRGGFAPMSSGAGMGMGNLAALMGTRITAYSGSVMHVADAKAVSVSAGDERTGVEIVVPLHQMHAVSGHVLAKTDAHAVNFGTVELADKNDSSMTFTVTIHEDGSFRFDYVPGNSEYKLTTHNVQDAVTTGTSTMLGQSVAKKKTLHNYGQVMQEVRVMDSDLDGVSVSVPGLP